MRARLSIVWILVLLPVSSASAQSAASGRPGPRAILPRGHEVALARSAAPAEVSRRSGGATASPVW
jgi:hypothetical protein